jgi:hypothetical protein
MLAGGMVVAAPSMVPTAAAAGALYVSAENAQFGNLFGGPQIVEVIVKDPARADTHETEGEPTVLVDNQQLRLAQGIDGNWYGYFGDSTDVGTVDDVSSDELDFGSDGATLTGTPAKTVAAFEIFKGIPSNGGVIDNPPQLSNWNASGNAMYCLWTNQCCI